MVIIDMGAPISGGAFMFSFDFDPLLQLRRFRRLPEDLPGFRLIPVAAESGTEPRPFGWQPPVTDAAQPVPEGALSATGGTPPPWWERLPGPEIAPEARSTPRWPWL